MVVVGGGEEEIMSVTVSFRCDFYKPSTHTHIHTHTHTHAYKGVTNKKLAVFFLKALSSFDRIFGGVLA